MTVTLAIKLSLSAKVPLIAAAEWRKMEKATVQRCLCAANASFPSATVCPGQAVTTSRTKSCSSVKYYVFMALFCKMLVMTWCLGLIYANVLFKSLKEINTFMYVLNWPRGTLNTFIMPQKTILRNCRSFKLYTNQRIPKKHQASKSVTTLTIIINVSWSANYYIRMISEGSCDTEDWRNSALPPRNQLHFKEIKVQNNILNCTNI